MPFRQHIRFVFAPGLAALLAATCLTPPARAQTSFIAPDGHNRYPGVTIFCPSGNGVAPCVFGGGPGVGGSGGGAVTVNLGTAGAVSANNRFPVMDPALDGLISGGALSVAGAVSLLGTPAISLVAGTYTVGGVTQAGPWTVSLGAGGNTIGTVGLAAGASVSLGAGTSLIGTVTVAGSGGAVSQSGNWTVALATGASVAVSALPTLPPGVNDIGFVDVNSLPALPSGSNAIGTVAVSNFPATVALSAGSSAIGTVAVANFPTPAALPAGSNAIGSVSVSNLPATQPVSAAALPLPAGAATAANQLSPLAPVAPNTATATNSVVIGCLANTTLPSFSPGQQGAVACDTSGHLYVVTVPSANNVPTYQQAVASGGAGIYRAINAAASAMAANVKSTTGMVYGYEACNAGSAAAYVRLFALATAPTVGTSIPVISKLLPAGNCQSVANSVGLVFNTGIAVDVTSGSMADNDTATLATASQVTVEVYFK